MTDGSDRVARTRTGANPEATVESLASRALSMLASKRGAPVSLLSERFLERLSEAALSVDDDRRMAVLHEMLEARIRREDIADFYIPEVARRLGDSWSADGMSFADVTIGVARLQGMLRDIASTWFDDANVDADAPALMIVVLDSEYHTLGPMVLCTQLRRMGMSVKLVVGRSESELLRFVASGHFDAILISASAGEKLASLGKLIEKIRSTAVRPTPVVVGGSVVSRVADVRAKTGADHVTTDPREALRQCGLKISVPGARRRATSE